MKRFTTTLISTALICFACAETEPRVQVKIDPAAYRGQWTLDYGPAQRGRVLADLATGSHVVCISGSELFFDLAEDGTVTVENRAAATGGAGTLTFKTTIIKVNPELFAGRWRVSAGATPDRSGVRFVTLVPGLQFYNLAVGANGGFSFDIAGDGTVTVRNALAATGGRRRLRFNNTERFRRRTSQSQSSAGPSGASLSRGNRPSGPNH